ncbi:MAG: HAMP domain-containing protein [Planctomycetes bacterium]|nr:HAMP domain-containing protein [Planctomycetota bacterium]MCW8135681.1 HAMP domain-containing protein [Planctomycetota bacterium]
MKKPSIWRSRLLWRLFAINVIAIVIFMAGAGTYLEYQLKSDLLEEATRDLEVRSRLVNDSLTSGENMDAQVRQLAQSSGARVTLIDPDGKVLADSEAAAVDLDNHGERPEVLEARRRGVGSGIRYSDTRRMDMLYVAYAPGEGKPIVRLAIPLRQVDARLRVAERTIMVTVAVLFLAGIGLSFLVARFIVRPIEAMRSAAQEIARGNLEATVELTRRDEFGELVAAFNTMSRELSSRVGQIEANRRELSAIMDNMAEGLLLIDSDGVVIINNRAAAEMLGSKEPSLAGRRLWEVIRLPEVDELLASLPNLVEPRRIWVEDRTHAQRRVLAFVATPLFDTAKGEKHAVLLISDATEDQKLLEMRQDFVANVSHELKTPLTSISAYCETLLDGAADDEAVRRPFLEKIQVNTERLTKLVSDILNISRLESGTGDESRTHIDLNELVGSIVRKHAEAAEKKRLKVALQPMDEPALALVNEEDMTEAVDNLIVNAISYTPEGGSVQVSVKPHEQGLQIEVKDTGVGIPAESLPRVFERFYRVDKARSRALGGTGLGLAIVKHVALKHGGKVDAESTVGKGSTFRIILPAAPAKP